ncbi:hypothetical protein BDV28DRAFT_97792 [Aspergillus coremiiformis]|uniref:Fungal-type protein kinase domain-containing protein n=1 Tax=Aspergillus coremiiformis TaxID=138285 RepID=A0A5N6Z8E0_9EURO|nr:hypothetical protein BDV28DRAFT_97792 [Aspergillus coremiiformis]
MSSLSKAEIIKTKPIGVGLDAFRDSLTSACADAAIPCSVDSLRQIDAEVLQNLSLDLISALQALPSSRVLHSISGSRNLFGDLLRLSSAINSEEFDTERLIPLFGAIFRREADDAVWDKVYAIVTESTPPPWPLPLLSQTPHFHTTSSFVNSSERRKHVDNVLKEELGSIYIDVPGFFEAYFGSTIDGLDKISAAVFLKCKAGDTPLFKEGDGWRDWPETPNEKEVLRWLTATIKAFRDIVAEEGFSMTNDRTILSQPDQPLQGSMTDRKLDIGFIDNSKLNDHTVYHWLHVLILGELKSNSSADMASKTWRDLGRYAKNVLTIQDTRRFVLGFTLCGSNMRLWEFDRVGAIASSSFDTNKDGLQFISIMLGFLLMNDEQLGHDPSILRTSDGAKYIEITRNGESERLFLEELMKRSACVAGRATTCWKARREGDQTNAPLVIKDSWQYPEREEEGKLLYEAREKGVINVARYYYHETVQVNKKADTIRENVRKGLDVTQSTNYKSTRSELSLTVHDRAGMGRMGRSSSTTGRKRSSSCTGAILLPSKRPCSRSPSKGGDNANLQDRVHRRVIVSDYGTPIYKARSRVSLLSALESCIEGYQSLHTQAGFLQGDVSPGNLILNEDKENPSWSAFLIDLDLAIEEQREQSSGARGKTGTRAFMAIGLLLDEQHSFRHDLESFFWVLFWICIHYDGPTKEVGPTDFDCWNYEDDKKLAHSKKGVVDDEGDFLKIAEESFTSYYQLLVSWVNRLRRVVFPGGVRRKDEDRRLYTQMKETLRRAAEDPKVLAL